MKITKKINHDSLWIKVQTGKVYTKLHIGRNGVKVTGTNGHDEMHKMFDMYNDCQKNKMTYGDTLDFIETKFA